MARKTKRNFVTSPELRSQVNPDNMQLLQDFLDYLVSVQRSEQTIKQYKSDIEIAFVWNLLFNKNKFFIDWTKRNVVAYQNWLINTNENSPARVRRLKAALSSMSNYLENICDDEYPEFRNIIGKVENPINQPVREKTVWEQKELEELIDKLVEMEDYKKACFLALAVYSGRRKSELCRFKVSDFNSAHLICGGSLYKSDPIKTKGRSGGKYLNCYTLAKKFKPYFDLWMTYRAEKGIESEWLFPLQTNPDEHINVSTANKWADSLSKMTGRDFYWHSIRHAWTGAMSDLGLPDGVIKEIQGWDDISMVSVYMDRSTEDTLEMYFDENGVKKIEKKGLSDL